MNNIEANKIIDEYVHSFQISFILGLNEEFNSISELLNYVRKEKKFWSKYKVYAQKVKGYEQYFKEIENLIVSMMIEVKQDENTFKNNFIYNIRRLNSNLLAVNFSEYNKILTINTRCISSNYKEINCILESYERFYDDATKYNYYLDLIKQERMLSNYLDSSDERNEVGIFYLSQQFKKYSIDVFSHTKHIEDVITNMQYTNIGYSEIIEENKQDIVEYINNAKDDFNTTIQEQIELNNVKRESINSLFEEKESKFGELEEAYEQKLHLEAPIKFWNDKSKEYANKSMLWFVASVVVSLILMGAGTYLVHMIYFNPASSKSEVITLIPKSFVLVAVVSLLVYILRVFIKVATSNNHLSLEYAQKASLTDFYLSLLQYENESISESDKTLIYSTLFGKVDTGLIKGSESNEIEKLVLSLLTKQS